MSKIRGVFPLLLATTFGIANGMWVFQPFLAAQQEGKAEQARKVLEIAPQSEESGTKTLREAEALSSRNPVTESVPTPTGLSSSWWPKLSLWSKAENAGNKEPPRPPPRVDPLKKDRGT